MYFIRSVFLQSSISYWFNRWKLPYLSICRIDPNSIFCPVSVVINTNLNAHIIQCWSLIDRNYSCESSIRNVQFTLVRKESLLFNIMMPESSAARQCVHTALPPGTALKRRWHTCLFQVDISCMDHHFFSQHNRPG